VCSEAAAQVDRRGEPDAGGDGFHGKVGLFQQYPCRVEALVEQPLSGAGAELFGEPPGEDPAREPGAFGEFADGEGVEPGGGPLSGVRGPVSGLSLFGGVAPEFCDEFCDWFRGVLAVHADEFAGAGSVMALLIRTFGDGFCWSARVGMIVAPTPFATRTSSVGADPAPLSCASSSMLCSRQSRSRCLRVARRNGRLSR
jgi:hypothetical protein